MIISRDRFRKKCQNKDISFENSNIVFDGNKCFKGISVKIIGCENLKNKGHSYMPGLIKFSREMSELGNRY